MREEVLLKKYRLEQLLGEGRTGHVYRAQIMDTGETVAVKRLHYVTDVEETIFRFRREIQVLSTISHPNIIRLLDWGSDGMHPFLVMEFLEGNTLKYLIKKGTLSLKTALQIILQIASALDYVHNKQLLHQDLKPSNIWLVGKEQTVKVLDFGLAHLVSLSKEKTRNIIGSYAYMPPEQSGMIQRSVDHRSDLYALGIICYEMLMGRRPFEADDLKTLLHQHTAKSPPKLNTSEHPVPVLLETIASKLLAKDPQHRYQSTSGLIYDLSQLTQRLEQGESNPAFELFTQDFIKDLNFDVSCVGREDELQQIQECWDSAQTEKQPYFVLVSSKTGMGKSMLVELALQEFKNQHIWWLFGKNSTRENSMPYRLLIRILQDLLQKKDYLPLDDQEQLDKILFDVMGEQQGPLIRLLPELEKWQSKADTKTYTPREEQSTLLQRLILLFEQLSSLQGGFVIAIDNLQWADAPSLQLIHYFLEAKVKSPILLLGSYREENLSKEFNQFLQSLSSFGKEVHQLRLKVFPEALLPKLIRQIFVGGLHNTGTLVYQLYESSSGNPSMIMDLLKSLAKTQVIQFSQQKWYVNQEKLRAFEFPKNITQIVNEQIEQLSEETSHLMTCAAIIGQEFDYTALFVLGKSLAIVDTQEQCLAAIDEALQADLIQKHQYPRNGHYSFLNDKAVSILISRIEQDEIPRYHEFYANWLQKNNQEAIDELAYHYNLSNHHENAIVFTRQAAKKAQETCANLNATQYFRQALNHLKQLPSSEDNQRLHIELAHHILTAGIYVSGAKEVLAILEEALSVAETLDDPQCIATVHNDIGRYHYLNGQHRKALVHFQQSLDLIEGTDNEEMKMRLINAMGKPLGFSGNGIAGIEMLKEGIALAEKYNQWDDVAYSYGVSGLFYTALGDFEQAIAVGKKSIAVAEQTNNFTRLTDCLCWYGWTLAAIGENLEEALVVSQRGLEYARKNKMAYYEVMALFTMVKVYYLYDNLEKADFYLRQALHFREQNPVVGIIDGLYHCYHSEMRFIQNRLEEADEAADASLAVSETPEYNAYALRLKAQIRGVQPGRAKEAEALFQKSLQLAESAHTHPILATIRWHYGVFKLSNGDWKEGISLMSQGEQSSRRLGRNRAADLLNKRFQMSVVLNQSNYLDDQEKNLPHLTSTSTTSSSSISEMLHRRHMDTIISVTQAITGELEQEPLLEIVINTLIETLGAEEGILVLYEQLPGEEEKLVLKTARRLESTHSETDDLCMWEIVNQVIQTRSPMIIADAQANLSLPNHEKIQGHGLRSVLCVPLIYKEMLLGAVLVHNRMINDLFSAEYVELMEILAGQSAVAIQNARLVTELVEAKNNLEQLNLELEDKVKRRTKKLNETLEQLAEHNQQMKEDLILAEEVQKTILLSSKQVSFLELGTRYLPHSHVSGDIYHISSSQPHVVNIFLGDATGHGVAAALTTIMTNTALLEQAKEPAISQIMKYLSQVLDEHLPSGIFMTGIYARVTEEGLLTFCNAGHPPLVIIPANGEPPSFFEANGPPLGFLYNDLIHYKEVSYQLQSGDKVFLYTDGITETRNFEKKLFGLNQLGVFLNEQRSLEVETILANLLDHLAEYSQGAPYTDDVAMLAFQYTP